MFKKVLKYKLAVSILIGLGLLMGVIAPAIGLGILVALGITFFIVDAKLKLSGDLMP
tara:strand:+ start:161 stop:331 length:171 start_codon:yes stop_codon:yes gene_type:complete